MFYPYFAHMRPLTFPISFVWPLAGYVISPQIPLTWQGVCYDLIALFFVYSVLLWGGTNALNTSQDCDEGPINLLPNPPEIPPYLSWYGTGCMICAIICSYVIWGWQPAMLCLIALFLSVIYSVKIPQIPWRAKEVGGMDIIINAGGCGLGSIWLGYAITNAPLEFEIFLLGIGFTAAVFGGYPASQIFQLSPQDKYSDARNYTSLITPKRALLVGPIFFTIHIIFLSIFAYDYRHEIYKHPIAFTLFIVWILFVVAAAINSWLWSYSPFTNPYHRMLRQFLMLMASQLSWTICFCFIR